MGLIEQYRKLHRAKGAFKGWSALKHKDQIADLIKLTRAKTVLDYGCGKGCQYSEAKIHKGWDCDLTLYDPAVDLFSGKPEGRFGGVVCTDVLEHLEERDVPAVLDEIFDYAEKFVFLSISTREARKKLPDGRNCHLTVKPKEWWENVVSNARVVNWLENEKANPFVVVRWNE